MAKKRKPADLLCKQTPAERKVADLLREAGLGFHRIRWGEYRYVVTAKLKNGKGESDLLFRNTDEIRGWVRGIDSAARFARKGRKIVNLGGLP